MIPTSILPLVKVIPLVYADRPIVEIVERHLGKGNKVGDCSRDQAQVIDLIVYDLKEIKK